MAMPKEAGVVDLLKYLASQFEKYDDQDIGLQSHAEKRSILPQSLSARSQPPDFPRTLPSHGLNLDETLEIIFDQITNGLPLSSLSANYYGFVTGGTSPAALVADWLVSIYDQNLAVHLPKETIATNVEVAALNLLVDLFNLPRPDWSIGTSSSGGGTFTTGATASNILGLALGREYVIREAIRHRNPNSPSINTGDLGLLEAMSLTGATRLQILSTLPHSSISKAASLVGIGRSSVISISSSTSTNPLDIDLSLLETHASDPFTLSILAISSGEVNTGHFATTSQTTMTHIRSICDKHGIWIHVDGAFGLFARLFLPPNSSTTTTTTTANPSTSTNAYSTLLSGVTGLELADSITGDGHKLLNVPYECGFFFTRHKQLSLDVFNNGNAAYLDTGVGAKTDYVQGPLNIGLENSRRWRALPVYASLMAYGREGYVEMLERQVGLARRVVRYLLGKGEEWVVLPERERRSVEEVVEGTFMVVLFRAKDEVVNEDLVSMINASGRIYVTGTKWDGKKAARIAVSNWRVDVERDFEVIRGVLEEVVRKKV